MMSLSGRRKDVTEWEWKRRYRGHDPRNILLGMGIFVLGFVVGMITLLVNIM